MGSRSVGVRSCWLGSTTDRGEELAGKEYLGACSKARDALVELQCLVSLVDQDDDNDLVKHLGWGRRKSLAAVTFPMINLP